MFENVDFKDFPYEHLKNGRWTEEYEMMRDKILSTALFWCKARQALVLGLNETAEITYGHRNYSSDVYELNYELELGDDPRTIHDVCLWIDSTKQKFLLKS